MKSQVLQRLVLVEQRIAHERRLLVEEIDDAVHDAGNAIELAIADRLATVIRQHRGRPSAFRGVFG
jgi:hypothetical protein